MPELAHGQIFAVLLQQVNRQGQFGGAFLQKSALQGQKSGVGQSRTNGRAPEGDASVSYAGVKS